KGLSPATPPSSPPPVTIICVARDQSRCVVSTSGASQAVTPPSAHRSQGKIRPSACAVSDGTTGTTAHSRAANGHVSTPRLTFDSQKHDPQQVGVKKSQVAEESEGASLEPQMSLYFDTAC